MTDVIVTRKKTVRVDTAANLRPPNVIVANQKNIQVSGGSAELITANPGTILSNPTFSSRLDLLRNVDASNQIEGASLVYDVASGKYVVSFVDLKYVKGSMAGGTF